MGAHACRAGQHSARAARALPELVHASVGSLARLALCSKAWNVADAVRTEQQWCAIFKEHESIPSLRGGQTPSDVRERAKGFEAFTSVHQLFGALFCQCDGPAACVAVMLQAMEAADNAEADSTAYVLLRVHNGLDRTRLGWSWQNARVLEWDAELFLSCYLAASGDCVADLVFLRADRGWLTPLVGGMRRKTNAFSVTFEQVQTLILNDPKMITTIAGRSYFIMQSYACFYDEYEFNAMATTMGSVAEMGALIEQVIDLISKLDEHEERLRLKDGRLHASRNATAACRLGDEC